MTSENNQKEKTCFVICPIGEINSKERSYSDKILKYLIEPVIIKNGYSKPIRADKISDPGIITSQVIDHLINSDLVIADLSNHNANVFYELAIRHVNKKPLVQIINKDYSLPFDVNQSRTIKYDPADPESVHNFKIDLEKQIKIVEKDPSSVDNPISVAIDITSLKHSSNALERSLGKVISGIEEMRYKISSLEDKYNELYEEQNSKPNSFNRINKIESPLINPQNYASVFEYNPTKWETINPFEGAFKQQKNKKKKSK